MLLGIVQGGGDEGSSEAVGVAKVGKKKKSKAAAAAGGSLDGTKKPPRQKRLDIMNAKVSPRVSFSSDDFGFETRIKTLGSAE